MSEFPTEPNQPRRWVLAAAIAAAIVIAAGSLSGIVIARFRNEAGERLRQVEDRQLKAAWQVQHAQQAAANAPAHVPDSEDAARRANAAFAKIISSLQVNRSPSQSGELGLRKELLEALVEYYQRQEIERNDPSARQTLAAAHYQLGLIKQQIESPQSALASFATARSIQEVLVREEPDSAHCLDALADTLNAEGNALFDLEKFDDALKEYKAAERLRQQLLDQSLENHEYRRVLANSLMNIGLVEQQKREYETACSQFEQAQKLRLEILEQQPNDLSTLRDLGKGHLNLARLPEAVVGSAESEKHYQSAIDALQRVLDKEGSDEATRFELAKCYWGLALKMTHSLDQACPNFALAMREIELVAVPNAEVAEYQVTHLSILLDFAVAEYFQRDLNLAREKMKDAQKVAERLRAIDAEALQKKGSGKESSLQERLDQISKALEQQPQAESAVEEDSSVRKSVSEKP